MSSIKTIINSLAAADESLTKKGVLYVSLNLVLTLIGAFLVVGLATRTQTNSWFDVFIEAGNTFMHFLLYVLISFLRVRAAIKYKLLVGFLLTQLGRFADFLDELYDFGADWWNYLGDSTYFVGGIFVIVGATQWSAHIYQHATIDPLTKIFNRRFFEQTLLTQIARIQRSEVNTVLLNLDLDNFKLINDKYGHGMGDQILKLVAKILRDNVRKSDLVCRSGGEEFEILLVDTNIEQAKVLVKRIRNEMRLQTPKPLEPITASIGITRVLKEDSIESARNRADKAMYAAKKGGKDKAVVNDLVS